MKLRSFCSATNKLVRICKMGEAKLSRPSAIAVLILGVFHHSFRHAVALLTIGLFHATTSIANILRSLLYGSCSTEHPLKFRMLTSLGTVRPTAKAVKRPAVRCFVIRVFFSRHNDQPTRQVTDVFYITNKTNCTSHAPVTLHEKEFRPRQWRVHSFLFRFIVQKYLMACALHHPADALGSCHT